MTRKFDMRSDPEGVRGLAERNARAVLAEKPKKRRARKKKPLVMPVEEPVVTEEPLEQPETD